MKDSSIRCGAMTCSNSKHQNPELQFHPFPADPIRCKQWVQSCGQTNFQDKRAQYLHHNAKLCSLHFEASHFFRNNNTQHLLPSAVPTMFTMPSQPPQVNIKQASHEWPESLANKAGADAVLETHGVRAEVGSEASEASLYILPDDPPVIKVEPDALPAVNERPFSHRCTPNPMKDEPSDAESEPDIKPFAEVEPFSDRSVSTAAGDASWNRTVSARKSPDGSSPNRTRSTEDSGRCSPSLHEGGAAVVDEVAGSEDTGGVATGVASAEQCLRCGATPLACECGRNGVVMAHRGGHTRDEQPGGVSDTQNAAPEDCGTTRLRADMSDKPHRCEICRMIFDSKLHLIQHWLTHTGGEPAHCEGAGKPPARRPGPTSRPSPDAGRAKAVEKRHKCDSCGKTFRRKWQLTVHDRTHTGETPYECDVCGKRFLSKDYLRVHYRRHTEDRRCVCDACGKAFRDRCELASHYLTHTGEKPYPCDNCGKRFRQKCTLTEHYRTHTGERPYTCHVCGKTYKYRSQLKPHCRSHTGVKPYACDRCDKRFGDKRTLRSHYRVHADEKPYRCDSCDRGFTRKSHLTEHLQTHTGLKPHKCDTCEMCFSRKSDMVRHRAAHTGSRPHRCDSCGKCFSVRSSLTLHCRSHLGEDHTDVTAAENGSLLSPT